MKRFTATEKWGKEWFQDLSLLHKCLWFYLCDQCDSAGVWEPNWRLASFQLAETVNVDTLAAFGDRVEVLPSGKVWIVKFVAFQNGKLSKDCKPHVPIIRKIGEHGLSERFPELIERVSIPYTKGIPTLEGKGMVKGKGTDAGGEGSGEDQAAETPPPAKPAPKPEPAGDDPELSAEAIASIIRRIFKSPRPVSQETLQNISLAMPVRRSEMARLERFYSEPPDPNNKALARCEHPTSLGRALADQLVKAERFYGGKNGGGLNGANGRQELALPGQATETLATAPPSDLARFVAAMPEYHRNGPGHYGTWGNLWQKSGTFRTEYAAWRKKTNAAENLHPNA